MLPFIMGFLKILIWTILSILYMGMSNTSKSLTTKNTRCKQQFISVSYSITFLITITLLEKALFYIRHLVIYSN